MLRLIPVLSNASLERLVTSLEARLLAGTASAEDIESYMRMQMELAERDLGPIEGVLDPRD